MLIRAKAPLRIGFAGGGSDVSPYSDVYGGAVLNATISMYAYATIKVDKLFNGHYMTNNHEANELIKPIKIDFCAEDRAETFSINLQELIPLSYNGYLDLHKGVFNYMLNHYCDLLTIALNSTNYFNLTTYIDAPAGSGLGTSSTLVVSIIGAFKEWLNLPLGDYDIANLAYKIEREELSMAGGKQDQYSATFGGFNFMEFYANNNVIVNPLRIKQDYINELEFNMLLYYTGTSRLSSKIIEAQVNNVLLKSKTSIEAIHKLKVQSIMMKETILKGNFNNIGDILNFGWQYKKLIAEGITNSVIDDIYSTAIEAGSTGGKLSGAGGGGFIVFYCPHNTRYKVIEALKKFGGEFRRFQFTKYGLKTWKV